VLTGSQRAKRSGKGEVERNLPSLGDQKRNLVMLTFVLSGKGKVLFMISNYKPIDEVSCPHSHYWTGMAATSGRLWPEVVSCSHWIVQKEGKRQ
jgi:hypothetical protein